MGDVDHKTAKHEARLQKHNFKVEGMTNRLCEEMSRCPEAKHLCMLNQIHNILSRTNTMMAYGILSALLKDREIKLQIEEATNLMKKG